MTAHVREYQLYVAGCERLGQEALPPERFDERWAEFEAHAELLKAAERDDKPPDIDAATRLDMRRRVNDDPFVRALLVGMAEADSAGSTS